MKEFIIRFNTTTNDGICEISASGSDEDFSPSDLSAADYERYFEPKKLRGEDWESLSEGLDDYEYWYFDMSHQEGLDLVKKLIQATKF